MGPVDGLMSLQKRETYRQSAKSFVRSQDVRKQEGIPVRKKYLDRKNRHSRATYGHDNREENAQFSGPVDAGGIFHRRRYALNILFHKEDSDGCNQPGESQSPERIKHPGLYAEKIKGDDCNVSWDHEDSDYSHKQPPINERPISCQRECHHEAEQDITDRDNCANEYGVHEEPTHSRLGKQIGEVL